MRNNQRKIVIVQARMESTRLPGKILLEVNGLSLLELQINRLRQAKHPDIIVLATTINKEDDIIVEFAKRKNIACFRGHPTDLLDRHIKCAEHYNAQIVAKIPSDVPLIDPVLVDEVFEMFLTGNYDYVSNIHPPTFPDGLDVEIMTLDALKIADKNGKKNSDREHTTTHLWDNPDKFKIGTVTCKDNSAKTFRITIDHPEDFELIKKIIHHFSPNLNFSYQEIIKFLKDNKDIGNINHMHINEVWYLKCKKDLNTIS